MPADKFQDAAHIPASRFSRLTRLGSLATGIAGGMLAEGARQLAQGKRPQVSDLLLTPQNAQRVADELARLRGAAMKVGQLLSMDAGDLLPPELTAILARLRAEAKPMPLSQLAKVLTTQWGKGWEQRFRQFSFQPMAAASIGQVHTAHTQDRRHLALKIQYPGVRQSIDSDVENVAALLRLTRLLPKTVDARPLLEEAKRQLHAEADYLLEASHIQRYAELLGDDPDFRLPNVHTEFTTTDILAMDYVAGVPIEQLAAHPQAERDRVMTLLLKLLLREIFAFHLVQTDPNFANYLYNSATGQLVLLDFGATRPYSVTVAEGYRQVLTGGMLNDRAQIDAGATQIGFFRDYIKPEQRAAVLELFWLACEPLRHAGTYDFGNSDLAARIRQAAMVLSLEQDYWHTPPADALFLHRKLGGMYLLAARLRARVDVAALFAPYAQPANT